MASGLTLQRRPQGRRIRKTYINILQARGHVSNQPSALSFVIFSPLVVDVLQYHLP
jgi:hypothetical protein